MAGQADRDAGPDAPFNGILKMDHGNDATTVHRPRRRPGRRRADLRPAHRRTAAEDDGWLLSLVYSAPEHRSRLVVLDARDVESDPVAVAHLRHHVPLGFHGTFTSRVAEA